MDEKLVINADKGLKDEKKEWSRPQIDTLPLKSTKGGEGQGTAEDATYHNSL